MSIKEALKALNLENGTIYEVNPVVYHYQWWCDDERDGTGFYEELKIDGLLVRVHESDFTGITVQFCEEEWSSATNTLHDYDAALDFLVNRFAHLDEKTKSKCFVQRG